MILNEDVPRRLSSWAILPIAALSLTVLSGISFAQERQGKLEKRKVEKRKHDVKIEVDGIQADVLRKVSKELSKAFGKDVKIRNFDEIDRVVQRLVREQTRKASRKNREDDRQDRPRRIVRRKGKENRKVEVRLHRTGGGEGEVEILEIENLLKGKLKKLEGLEGTIRKALKDANVEIMDLGGKLKLELHQELHGLGDTIREALQDARVHVLESDDFEVLHEGHRRMILRVLGGDGDAPKIHVRRGGKDVDVDVLLEKVRGKLHQHDDDDGDHKRIIRRVLGGKAGNARVHVLHGGDAKFHVIRRGKGGDINIEAIVKKALGKAHQHDDDHVRIIERVLGGKAGNIEVRVLRGGDPKFHVIRSGKGHDVNIEAIVKKALGKAHKHDDDHVRIIERVLGGKAGNIEVRVLRGGDAKFHVIRSGKGHDVNIEAIVKKALGKAHKHDDDHVRIIERVLGDKGHDVDVEAIIEKALGKHGNVIIRRGKAGTGSDKKHRRIIRLHIRDGDDHHIRILKDGELKGLDIDLDGILEGFGDIKIEGLDGVIHETREKQKSGRESKKRKKKLRPKKKIV